jgi:hypothetical protein
LNRLPAPIVILALVLIGASPATAAVGIPADRVVPFPAVLADTVPGVRTAPQVLWGAEDGMVRYNRIEGLSVGLGVVVPLGERNPGWSAHAEGRIGTADQDPGGELRLERATDGSRQFVGVFRRLTDTSDWHDFLDPSSSLSALVSGSDRGEYYRTGGVEVGGGREREGLSVTGRLFAERQRSARRHTSFHLWGVVRGDTLRTNMTADEGTWLGGSVHLRGESARGPCPGALMHFGTLRLEAAVGPDGWYRRVLVTTGLSRELGSFDGTVEAGVGRGWGHLPLQRHFFVSGPSAVHGLSGGSLVGGGFWFGRSQIVRGRMTLGAGLFSDLGRAGPWRELARGRPVAMAGANVSLLDGNLRLHFERFFTGGRAG